MIDGGNFFDQPVKNDLRTYNLLKKCNYITDCLLNYPYFKEHYKLITID